MKYKSRFRIILEGYLIGLIITFVLLILYYIHNNYVVNEKTKETDSKQVISDSI